MGDARTTNNLLIVVIVLLGAIVVAPVLMCGGCLMLGGMWADSAAPAKPEELPKASAEVQAKRLEAIGKLRRAGVIHKIDTMGGTAWKVYVDPLTWSAMTIDDKQTLAALCFAWAYDVPPNTSLKAGDLRILTVRDATSGKDLATFSQLGLRLN